MLDQLLTSEFKVPHISTYLLNKFAKKTLTFVLTPYAIRSGQAIELFRKTKNNS